MLQLEELPANWGFPPGSLCLMGASPDATVCHLIPLDTPAALHLALQLQCALQSECRQQAPTQQQEHANHAHRTSPNCRSTVDLLRAALALVALRHSCAAHGGTGDGSSSQLDPDLLTPNTDSSQVDDKDEEDAEVYQSRANSNGQHDKQQHQEPSGAEQENACGVSTLARSVQSLQIDNDAAASTSTHRSGAECRTSDQSYADCCGNFKGAMCELCHQEHSCQSVAMPPGWQANNDLSSGRLYGALTWQAPLQGAVSVRCLQGRCWLMLREAVEVKNSCPFQVIGTLCNACELMVALTGAATLPASGLMWQHWSVLWL